MLHQSGRRVRAMHASDDTVMPISQARRRMGLAGRPQAGRPQGDHHASRRSGRDDAFDCEWQTGCGLTSSGAWPTPPAHAPAPSRVPRHAARQHLPRLRAVAGAAGGCRAGRLGVLARGALSVAAGSSSRRTAEAARGPDPARPRRDCGRRNVLCGRSCGLAPRHRATTLANAALLSNAASFLLPLFGYLVARRLPGRYATLALMCAAAGTALLLGRSADVSARHFSGDLLCLAAAVLYTGYLILVDARAAALPR